MTALSHLDSDGRARMVDVGGKPETDREAVARGRFTTTPEVVRLVAAEDLPKADVLATARIAGIGGAKRTSELIPLCHPLPLSSVSVGFDLDAEGGVIEIESRARTRGRTGVEMEALTAVAVAGLTLHDMVKAVDPAASLGDIRLVAKSGGKRGDWSREGEEEPVVVTHAVGTRRNVTGSRGGVTNGLAVLDGLLPGQRDQLRGDDHS